MKKKICFVSLNNLYLSPYINNYISNIDSEYDAIYWNRHQINEDIGASNHFEFNYSMDEEVGKFKKIRGYLKFRQFVLKKLNNYNYDGVVLLHTSIGILIYSFLSKKYTKKFIIDIRDYTMENNPLFFFIEKKLIKKSALAIISSEGYKNFLPSHDYILDHNNIHINEEIRRKFLSKNNNKDKIVISYIGLIRFHEQNKEIILKFKNDERYLLKFIGKNAKYLKKFCEENDVTNVELIDRFPPEKTLDFYYETDLIYNLYGNNSPLLDYALSNKLYYALNLKIPILVCPKTYMETISINSGVGIVFDKNNPKALDKLYNDYQSIDWAELIRKSDLYLENIEQDDKKFKKFIKNFEEKL